MTNNALPLVTTSVVLVHGATMDGSSWRPVHDILKAAGLEVAVVQLPLANLKADVDATLLCIARQIGNVVLVGHSYGGVVASVAGTHPKVRALVYVAALQPDEGESLASLAARYPSENHMLDLGDGTIILDPVHYAHDMADDISHYDAAFLAASQRPTAMAIFGTPITQPAWREKPSYAVFGTNDRILNPELARFMYARANSKVIEIEASHVPHLSHPKVVAGLILGAINS